MAEQDRRMPLVAFGLVAVAVVLGLWFFGLGPKQPKALERAELSRWLQDYVELVERREGPFAPGGLDGNAGGRLDRIFALQDEMPWSPQALARETEFGFGLDSAGGITVFYDGYLGSCRCSSASGPVWAEGPLEKVLGL